MIPIILQTALGQREAITIFGTDYPTPDGTCIRDYIHVEDLCAAHIYAMESLRPGEGCFYNLGIGCGYSVREVLEAARRVTGRDIPVEIGPSRAGDPGGTLCGFIQDPDRTRLENLNTVKIDPIVTTVWEWYKSHPAGYGD